MTEMIRRNQVVFFFLITFLISWTLWIGVGIIGQDPESPLVVLGVYGPTLAAVIVSGIVGKGAAIRKLLRGVILWRVGIQWYAIALLGPWVLELLSIGIYSGLSGTTPDVPLPSVGIVVGAILATLLMNILLPGLGEEPGWRGFALPMLQGRWSPVVASLGIGLVWAVWHFPGYWMGNGIHNAPPLLFVVWVLPFAGLIAWVFNSAKRSILLAILLHASLNTTIGLLPFLPSEADVPISPELIGQLGLTGELYGPYRVFTLLLWISFLAIALITKGRLGHRGNDESIGESGLSREGEL